MADDSVVVFVSCVFEYVGDLGAARREVLRSAGDPANVFAVTVQPWTFTAALYPGARWAGTAPRGPIGPTWIDLRGLQAYLRAKQAAARPLVRDVPTSPRVL